MALPPSSDFTGASITEGQFKTAITSLRTYLATLLGTDESNKVAALTALGAVLNSGVSKSGAYTVVAADKGKVINATGTWTLSVTAAATLGDGFTFAVFNSGSGTITIDPNASELIDGATTKNLEAGKLAIVYCDGVRFVTVGSIATGSGSGLDADLLDGNHASVFSRIDTNTAVGATAYALGTTLLVSGKVNNNATSAVYVSNTGAGYSTTSGTGWTAVSGTWRCKGYMTVCVGGTMVGTEWWGSYADLSVFQRVA